MRPILVRRAEVADHAAVGDLLVAAYAPSGMPADNPSWNSLRNIAARTVDAEVWVAEAGGDILGTVTWTPLGSGQREIGKDDEAEFRMLAVAPDTQGRGVWRALLAAVIERAGVEGTPRWS